MVSAQAGFTLGLAGRSCGLRIAGGGLLAHGTFAGAALFGLTLTGWVLAGLALAR
jgi:hypothetical protein